jgi:hypothetical protein
MNDPREANLPKWARELIATLRLRLASATEPLTAEVARLRPQVDLLQRKLDAIEELLTCAARGGHKTAAEIIEVLESYDLQLSKD